MKKRIVTLTLVAAMMIPGCAEAKVPKTRTATGTYYDYMCIETKDGHEWLLPDAQKASNPYMKRTVVKYNGKRKVVYMPRFKDGQKVRVTFNTRGTKRISDDKIIKVTVIR